MLVVGTLKNGLIRQLFKYCKFGFFARILFAQMAFKDIFSTLEIRDKGVIYLYQ